MCEQAARWWAVADALLPGAPRPSAVDDAEEWTRRLLAVRPELADRLDEFAARATVVAGAHYLNPVVRKQIGYPGQEPVAITVPEDGLDDDLLRAVRDRGA